MLERLECYNFKSYKGHVTIGPFHSFTSVIGPNGAGKSNLMDAISFVLGVRSSTLRSAALKDLIYRRGRRRATKTDQQDDEEVDEEDEEDEEEDKERHAYVKAVYYDNDDKQWNFQRSVSANGTSEYRLNDKVITFKKYNDALENFNILVKAKNFLVFQGDVEAVASQSPTDLAKLIDQISGSLDLKEQYDRCARELEKASDASVLQHSRRKGMNTEVKQYKEMQKEAERYNRLGREKANAIIHHLLYKLFHIESNIDKNFKSIETKNEQLGELRRDHTTLEESLKTAKKEYFHAHKQVTRAEKEVKAEEKHLEDTKPELLSIDTKIQHAQRKLDKATDAVTTITRDLENDQEKLQGLQEDYETIGTLAEKHSEKVAKEAQAKGIVLDEATQKEYKELKTKAAGRAPSEKEELRTLSLDEKNTQADISSLENSLEMIEKKLEKVDSEREAVETRVETLQNKTEELEIKLAEASKESTDFQERMRQTKQTERELNEKLANCLTSLQQANADRRESERDVRLRETLASLKRTFPGVRGRIIDLCKPTHQKYALAVTTVFGRNTDSVIVDTERTAIQCIEYLRVQRSGQATFIPLDTIQSKPINDKYRAFVKGARLAIDIITFDSSLEKALHHVCGNSLICDTMDVARHVIYDKGQEVKAVTLDGTVIHRSGLITGGNSTRRDQGTQFDDQAIEALRKRQKDLMTKLNEINKNKPATGASEQLLANIRNLESDFFSAQDDHAAAKTRLKDLKAESTELSKNISSIKTKLKSANSNLEKLEKRKEALIKTIDAADAEIFNAFCKKIGVFSIREYEEKQLKVIQPGREETLRYEANLAKLKIQIEFVQGRISGIEERLKAYETTVKDSKSTIKKLNKEKIAATEAIDAIEQQIEARKTTLEELKSTLDEKTESMETTKRQENKSQRYLDKALKEIVTWNAEIEQLSAERFALYRRCKLEEIHLPVESGSLAQIPLEENLAEDVAMEDEDGTQPMAEVKNYGIVVDYDMLDEDQQEEFSKDVEEALLEKINDIQANLEKMSPNLKAIERLGDSEARFRETEKEFEAAREATKKAKDAFVAVKKQRCKLFNKAYEHISGRIDAVYKDLTKGTMAPTGGVAYLNLEDTEEPYLHGIKYHAMPPMKRFREMEQLSGGEKTMAALALLFAIHSFHPSPFFVLDEVDAALDNTNVSKLANYIRKLADPNFQFIVISLKPAFFQRASALVGVYREDGGSRNLTLDLTKY